MTTLAIHSEPPTRTLIKPEPRSPISVRVATERDLKFIDSLQKKHSKELGFAPTDELLGYIKDGTALIAEGSAAVSVAGDSCGRDARTPQPIGYCLYKDRYMKREDCGIVSQLVVDSSKHRGLVGAALIQAMFERLPYGVRLFCLWCAQDLPANHFWEALGFVPLAYRSGSRGKEHGGSRKDGTRIHIFWQRRVREGDEYPYWFPSITSGGRAKEDRLSLPIQAGKHWSDELLIVLPGMEKVNEAKALESEPEESTVKRKRPRRPKPKVTAAPLPQSVSNGLCFVRPEPTPPLAAEKPAPRKPKRERQKNDPTLVRAAREFRDRYLEEVNTGRMLPCGGTNGKYDVSRQLAAAPSAMTLTPAPHLLQAA